MVPYVPTVFISHRFLFGHFTSRRFIFHERSFLYIRLLLLFFYEERKLTTVKEFYLTP